MKTYDVYSLRTPQLKLRKSGLKIDLDSKDFMSAFFDEIVIDTRHLGQAMLVEVDADADVWCVTLYKEPAFLIGPKGFDAENFPVESKSESFVRFCESDKVKQSVHNNTEARALLKEWDDSGQFAEQDIDFYTHDGKYLGTATWDEKTQSHTGLV